jgi:hypothetical protein
MTDRMNEWPNDRTDKRMNNMDMDMDMDMNEWMNE